jgi:hypothetical protein
MHKLLKTQFRSLARYFFDLTSTARVEARETPVLPREATLRGSPSPRLPSHQLTEFALVLNLSLLAGNKRRGVPSETLQKRTGGAGRSQSLGGRSEWGGSALQASTGS